MHSPLPSPLHFNETTHMRIVIGGKFNLDLGHGTDTLQLSLVTPSLFLCLLCGNTRVSSFNVKGLVPDARDATYAAQNGLE